LITVFQRENADAYRFCPIFPLPSHLTDECQQVPNASRQYNRPTHLYAVDQTFLCHKLFTVVCCRSSGVANAASTFVVF